MEILNLGDAIAQLKVYRWEYQETDNAEAKKELMEKILNLIREIEVPQLISGSDWGAYS